MFQSMSVLIGGSVRAGADRRWCRIRNMAPV
jgi:hypothetical protein